MQTTKITRRDSMIALGAAAGTLAWSCMPRPAFADTTALPARRRALRLAHLTDVHVQPEKRAAEGLAACLHHVQQLADQPQLILTGGDHVMDSFGSDDARTSLQWNIWHDAVKKECSLPVHSCIGNHDIWG